MYVIKDNMPVNAEGPPAHIQQPALSGLLWIYIMKQDSRKSATVHMILTHVGLFLIRKLKA